MLKERNIIEERDNNNMVYGSYLDRNFNLIDSTGKMNIIK